MLRRLFIVISVFFLMGIFIFSLYSHEKDIIENDIAILHSSTEKIDLNRSLSFLEDTDHSKTIEDVLLLSASNEFTSNKGGIPNYGYTSSAYWVKFELKNTSLQKDWLLEISYPPLNHLTVYITDGSAVLKKIDSGGKYPFKQREIEHRNFIYNLQLEQQETQYIFIRFETEGSMQMPITVWESNAFIEKSQREFTFLGLFYGIAAAMALYNVFLYFSLKDQSYLFYVLVIVSNTFSHFSLNGLSFQFLWPELPWWNMRSIVFFVELGSLFSLMFAYRFLDIHKNLPKYKKLFKFSFITNILIIGLLFISYKVALNLMVIGIALAVYTILTGTLFCWKRRVRQARFFFLGWVVFLIGVLVTILSDSAILPLNNGTKYAAQIASTVEMILLSFALADKINIMRKEKEKAEREAIESQRLAMENLKRTDELKDEFLTVTSHELRTPLYGMIGIAESLRDGAAGDITEEMGKQLEMIISSGKRLSHLVNDILDLSKLRHNDLDIYLQPVHLDGIVNIVLTTCWPLIRNKQVRMINEIPSLLPPIHADQNRLTQILYNLIGNAIKYTDVGEIRISAIQKEESISISVADTGRGIPEEKLKVIFEPFQRASGVSNEGDGGTGIGLNITKKLVELHNGEISVISKIGTGSIFTVSIPIYQNGEEYQKETVDISDHYMEENPNLLFRNLEMKSRKKMEKILVADDEPVNLQVLYNQLSLEGYEVITASSGDEILKVVETQEIELLILDIMMPKISGYEVCRRLRTKYTLNELPIIMLTAKSQLRDKIISFEVGANDYLTKPCDKEELLARVKTLINLRKLTKELRVFSKELEQKVKERTIALEIANNNLKTVNNELRNLEQSRTQLLTSITHELGTPITLIQSYIQAVREGLVEGNNSRYLDMIHKRLLLLDRLTRDLLELAKLQSNQMDLHFQQVGLEGWLKRLIQGMEVDVIQGRRKFICMNHLKNIEHLVVTIDVERMDQVFSNLISNALKHTATETGQITITTTLQTSDWKETEAFDGSIKIVVEDNGEGIAENDLPYIFNRFFQAESNTKSYSIGVGLGLAITKEIVQNHRGEIGVESKEGEGSKFYVILPLLNKHIMEDVG